MRAIKDSLNADENKWLDQKTQYSQGADPSHAHPSMTTIQSQQVTDTVILVYKEMLSIETF